jgi:tetratricopeptide (TPR) repeat protein
MSTTAQRYPGQEFDWFFWCCRTGRGDRKSAAQLAEQTAVGLDESQLPSDHERIGVYYLLKGDKKKAREQFRWAHERSKSPWPGMQWALLASEAGDIEERDRAIESVIREGQHYRSPDNNNFKELVELAQWMNNVWHDPEKKEPDLDAVEEICKRFPGGRSNVEFYTGCMLRDLGNKEKAEQYWQRTKDAGRRNYWNVMVAAQWLRQ